MSSPRPLVVGIVHPGGDVVGGNRTTATRWAERLGELGHETFVAGAWDGRPCDVLVALHAARSADSIRRFHAARPDAPLVVGVAGTDVYSDAGPPAEVAASLELADRVVVLQPLATHVLPASVRGRARLVYQSCDPAEAGPPTRDDDAAGRFEVTLVANLRPVKDPLCAAAAARLLPERSRVRVGLIGAARDEALAAEARREAATCPRFHWLGPLPRAATLGRLRASDLALCTSRHEGGPNALTEALALGVPIVASRVPGCLGLLGEDHPGTFAAGDAAALAELLGRADEDPAFLARLRAHTIERAWITAPELERRSWRALLAELAPAP